MASPLEQRPMKADRDLEIAVLVEQNRIMRAALQYLAEGHEVFISSIWAQSVLRCVDWERASTPQGERPDP